MKRVISLQSKLTSASQQTGGIEVQSTGIQGLHFSLLECNNNLLCIAKSGNSAYSSPFETNVLSILQALNETMQQMKSNPSVSQSEVSSSLS